MRYGVHGDLLSESEYEKHLSRVLPDAGDERVLNETFKDWVLQMNWSPASSRTENPSKDRAGRAVFLPLRARRIS